MAQKLSAIGSEGAPAGTAVGRRMAADLLRAMRPHHWLKNAFVLAPLLFGRKLGDPEAVLQALFAFAGFCLLSSSIYLANDVVDAEEDRTHPVKSRRPVASGAVGARVAWLTSAVLLGFGLGIVALVGVKLLFVASLYWGLMLGYCIALKRIIVLDAMVVASGFVLRVVGGAIAVDVVPTHWLVVCAFLLALYLAFAKRRQEMLSLSDQAPRHRRVFEGYTIGYLDKVNNILIGATVVCYALYTVAPETTSRFGTDSLIYGTAFVMYGLFRYMALTQDEKNGGDPAKVLITDRPLLIAVVGWILYNAIIIYRPGIGSI